MAKLNIEVTIIFVQQIFVVWHHIMICKCIPFAMTVCYIHIVRILMSSILRITVFRYFCCCLVILGISKSTTSINHTAKRRIVLSTRSMQHERCHCNPLNRQHPSTKQLREGLYCPQGPCNMKDVTAVQSGLMTF